MTVLDKVMTENTELDRDFIMENNCPSDFFPSQSFFCSRECDFNCEKCWSREVEE